MTISTIDNSQRTAAKVAGFAVLFSMVIVVFANYVLLNPLLVRGNAAETARNSGRRFLWREALFG
jgi:hypothetical protein